MTEGSPEVLHAWSKDKGTGGVPSTTALSLVIKYLAMVSFIIIDVMRHPPLYSLCSLLFLQLCEGSSWFCHFLSVACQYTCIRWALSLKVYPIFQPPCQYWPVFHYFGRCLNYSHYAVRLVYTAVQLTAGKSASWFLDRFQISFARIRGSFSFLFRDWSLVSQ